MFLNVCPISVSVLQQRVEKQFQKTRFFFLAVPCAGWPLKISTKEELRLASDCTMLYGSLEITHLNLQNQAIAPADQLSINNITGYLLVSGVRGVESLDQLLPNLTFVHGLNQVIWNPTLNTVVPLFSIGMRRVDLVISDTTLERIGDLKLGLLVTNQSCPKLAIVNNPLLCGVTVNSDCTSRNGTILGSNGRPSICAIAFAGRKGKLN